MPRLVCPWFLVLVAACGTSQEGSRRSGALPETDSDGAARGTPAAPDTMNPITAMHELGHVAGVGGPRFGPLIVGGIYTGTGATTMLRGLTADPAAELHGDTQHFWPCGLNYTK